MATELILPRVDMDMTEGKIAHWYVKNGDIVTKGQVVFEIETDKATMEIDAPESGVVQGVNGEIGVLMPVGLTVGWILQPGEVLPLTAASSGSAENEESTLPSPVGAVGQTASEDVPSDSDFVVRDDAQVASTTAALLRATPLARTVARELGIDLASVKGSGPDGRVLAGDLPKSVGVSNKQFGAPASASRKLHLHWFSKGAGTPVVLLHGFGASSGSWRLLAEELGDMPVLGIDLPNHGKSARFATADFAAVASSVLQRLDEEGIDVMHLVGHSMGGGTALSMAGLLKSRLRSLTLLAPAGMGPEINGAFVQGLIHANQQASLRPWLAELFGDASRLTESFVVTAWKELKSSELRQALAGMADCLLPDGTQAESLRALLDSVSTPLKVIWGTLDRIAPIHQAKGLPGSVALHALGGVGHLPHLESSVLVARLIRHQVAAGDSGDRH